jgi:hypothetical protein
MRFMMISFLLLIAWPMVIEELRAQVPVAYDEVGPKLERLLFASCNKHLKE